MPLKPLIALAVLALLSSLAAAETSPLRGTAVFLPATPNAASEIELAKSGTVAIHALATTPESLETTRTALRPAAGIASALLLKDASRLPYPDHFHTYLQVNLDALAKTNTTPPTRNEMLRVLAPNGRLSLIHNGKTETITKPTPDEMDTWPAPHGNAHNNPVSSDKIVAPLNTLKFVDSYARFGYHMSQAALPVIAEGAMLHELKWNTSNPAPRLNHHRLVCRDAHNGVVRWQIPIQDTDRWTLITGQKAITSARPVGKSHGIYAFDLLSGKPLGSIDLAVVKNRNNDVNAIADPAGKTLFVAFGPDLRAYNLADLSLRWTYTSPHDTLFSPTLSTDGKTLTIVENAGKRDGARWPAVKTSAITALDPDSGKTLWQNTDVKDTITSFTPTAGKHLFYYCTSGILTMTHEGVSKEEQKIRPRYFGVIDLNTGKRLWQKNWKDPDGTSTMATQVGMIRNNLAWVTSPNWVMGYDLDSGDRKVEMKTNVVNQRCVRTKATDNYLLMGFGTFLATDLSYTDQNIARSGCATGSTPAYGAIYQTADGCGCFAQVRGFAAFASQTPFPEIPHHQRLETFPPSQTKTSPQPLQKIEPPASITIPFSRERPDGYPIRIPVITNKPVLDSAINNEVLPYPETSPVPLPPDRTLVAVVSQHRLECRKDNTVLWSYTADARITGNPLVYENRIYLAARDGTVTCLDPDTGAPVWRYLVAPSRRFVMAYGQFESAWPVPNVVLHEGQICAAAGRHPELDGGIYLAGLDPRTGQPHWTGRIHKNTASQKFTPTSKLAPAERHVNRITNGGLAVNDGKLALVAFDRPPGSPPQTVYEIDPATPPK